MAGHQSLSIATLARLKSIFHALDWHRSSTELRPNRFDALFDAYCKMLVLLAAAEQDLILTLTQGFLLCEIESYDSLLTQALNGITVQHLGEGQEVFVIPFTEPKDSHLAKSGSLVAYLVKAKAGAIPAFAGKNIISLASIAALGAVNYDKRSNATVIFVDDYIGTGDTAVSALDEYDESEKKDDDRLLAVSLVMLRAGYERLHGRVDDVFAARIRDRGISDSKVIVEKEEARQLMRTIESRLKIEANYQLGYSGSEGLEKMARTPDNTFPVFWHRGHLVDDVWPAPFPR